MRLAALLFTRVCEFSVGMREGSEIAKFFHEELLQGIRQGTFTDIEKLVQQLDLIQELPHIIDPYVQSIFDQLGPICVQSVVSGTMNSMIDDLYRVIYQLTKLRGAKVISKSRGASGADTSQISFERCQLVKAVHQVSTGSI